VYVRGLAKIIYRLLMLRFYRPDLYPVTQPKYQSSEEITCKNLYRYTEFTVFISQTESSLTLKSEDS